MNYELTKSYFKIVNKNVDNTGSLILFLIGSATFFGCFAADTSSVQFFSFILSVMSVGLGIYFISSKKKKIEDEINSIPSDEQYDSEVIKRIKDIKTCALHKLGVDKEEVNEIAPIAFDGYVYKGANHSKMGKDNLYRTDKYESVVLFFSQNEVHCYTYRFDTTQDKVTEETDVYFYKDIVSVSTASDTVRIDNQNIDYEYFKLTTTGGNVLTVSVRNVNNAQKSINAMRALLREKKQG